MHKGWQHQHNSLEETSLSLARNKAKQMCPIQPAMKQTERIQMMEERLDRASQVLENLSSALDSYVEAQEDIRALDAYYGSEEWKQDYADDEAQRLPQDLKRGVLSEDAIWDMLDDNQALQTRIKEMAAKM